uniref:Uncharacterized protein n=1 Tax=Tanacetum cinerariifolium TaxID=118510 RepID=A0A6L2MIX8_TANCI|nr:hypothetical protein [Tanacetum cinerariifolium]
MDPEDSLIMGDEDLNTIPEKKTDEVIKYSVEDLVPIQSESEDTSETDSEYDLSSCDDFSPIDILEGKSVTFSNPLFDSNDDFTSSDDESLSDEDVPKDKVKIYSNPLFEFDDKYISNDPDLLFTHFLETNEDECFDSGGDIDEIGAFLEIDVSTDIKDGYYYSKGDIIYLENLLTYDIIHSLLSEMFLDHNPKGLKDEPNDDDLKYMFKIFNSGIHEKKFSLTYVSLPFEDRQYLFFTYVIRIFLPYFTYPVDSPFLLSSGSVDTIFDPSIFASYFLAPVASHRSGTFISFNVYPNILNETSMEICSSTRFNPNITMIWGESS